MDNSTNHTISFSRDEVVEIMRAHMKAKRIKFNDKARFEFEPHSHSHSVKVTWDE